LVIEEEWRIGDWRLEIRELENWSLRTKEERGWVAEVGTGG